MDASSPSATPRATAQTLVVGRWLDLSLVALAALAWFATPLRSIRLASEWSEPVAIGLSLSVTLLTGIAAIRLAGYLPAWLPRLRAAVSRLPLTAIVALGLLLRLAWIAVFPAVPASDGSTYLFLATTLAEGGEYETAGTRAYWPPGFPLLLSAWMNLFGTSRAAWIAFNLALYVAAVYGVARLAATLANPQASRLAALLFALWPNLIALSATPNKEILVVALLPWASWMLIRALRAHSCFGMTFLAGALTGFAILVQPSNQLLLPLFALLLLVMLPSARRSFQLVVTLMLGAAVVIAPWTIRNYQEFGEFVLVSTNGGSNLYRANNPLATGGYTPRGEVSLSQMSELVQDREGKRLALEWIRGNPADFVQLAVEKQIRLMGDDSAGVFNTLKVGKGSQSALAYIVLKGAANAWWMAMWLLLAAAVLARRNARSDIPPWSRLPVWFWLYFFVLHSVFESSGKYHVPALWALSVLIGVYMLGRNDSVDEAAPVRGSPSPQQFPRLKAGTPDSRGST